MCSPQELLSLEKNDLVRTVVPTYNANLSMPETCKKAKGHNGMPRVTRETLPMFKLAKVNLIGCMTKMSASNVKELAYLWCGSFSPFVEDFCS